MNWSKESQRLFCDVRVPGTVSSGVSHVLIGIGLVGKLSLTGTL